MRRLLFGLLCFVSVSVSAGSSTETSGDIIHLLLPATAIGASVYLEDNYSGTIQLAKAGITSRVIVEALKLAVPKDRPDGSGDDAYASGHTADSFAAATFLYRRYGFDYGFPAYLASIWVAHTRMKANKHEVEDVILGAVIGSFSSLNFTTKYNKLEVTPVAKADGYVGVLVSSRF